MIFSRTFQKKKIKLSNGAYGVFLCKGLAPPFFIMIYQAEIPLCAVSKSNSYKVGRNNRLKVNKEVETFEYFFIKLLPEQVKNANIKKPFKLVLDLWLQNKNQDLDNCSKSILDCLETAGAIYNDNLCYELIMRKHIDEENPKIKLKLSEL